MKQGGALTVKIVYSSFVTIIDAGVAQLVELHVANVVVAGSSPVSRSVHEESPVRPCVVLPGFSRPL